MVCRIALQHNEAQVGVDFVRREDQYERTATIPALIEDRASKSTLHRNGRGIALRKLPKLGLNKKGTGVLLVHSGASDRVFVGCCCPCADGCASVEPEDTAPPAAIKIKAGLSL
jgi:hypothetical protein